MKIQIDKKISFNNKSRPLLIAEISANHCGSKKSFLSHIISAKKNGADLVKIQTYEAKDMIIKENFVIDNGTWKKYFKFKCRKLKNARHCICYSDRRKGLSCKTI